MGDDLISLRESCLPQFYHSSRITESNGRVAECGNLLQLDHTSLRIKSTRAHDPLLKRRRVNSTKHETIAQWQHKKLVEWRESEDALTRDLLQKLKILKHQERIENLKAAAASNELKVTSVVHETNDDDWYGSMLERLNQEK